MSKRKPETKTPEPTSLRRSPRLLQLKLSPKTPIATSETTSVKTPQIRSKNRAKTAINLKYSDNKATNYAKPANRFGNYAKSANGSRRKSNLGNELNDGFMCNDPRSVRKLKKVGLVEIDSLEMEVVVCSPVTPVGVGEEKCRGFIRRCSDSEPNGSGVLSIGESERRITRSCFKKMGGNVGGKCETRGSVVLSLGGSERRVTRSCVNKMGGIVESSEMENRNCVRLVRGAIRNGNVTKKEGGNAPGVGRGRRCSRENVSGRITRSGTKRIAKGSDLCGEDRERRNKSVSLETSLSARLVGEEVKEKESKGTKLIGVKRKRKQVGIVGKDQGWTNEQEVTLQRAYFAAKPSPHFWKKVSKLVPGKSAQECFDKVHSANLTPLSARHSSRLKKQNSPSECMLSSDELLKPIPTKSKRHFKTKQKSNVTRRNVRHLLQKYCHNSEADLFSILEPSGNPLAETPKLKAVELTPLQSLGSPGSSSKCRSMSSLGHNKRLSRLSGVNVSPLLSPPVLKRVKNMALHEKYIDQLHAREGKRKVVFSRYSKSVQCQNDGAQSSAQRKGAIKAAKDALASDARDVIEKFRDSQTNLMEAYSDSEDVLVSDNDEDDMAL